MSHLYLSCACLHGEHEQCGKTQHGRGEPGVPHCKFCPATCLCPPCNHNGGQPWPAPTAFYRAINDGQIGAPTWRAHLHILETHGTHAGQQGLCGASARTHQHSRALMIRPMPAVPPAGVPWCGRCIGYLIELSGQLELIAALLSGRPHT